VLCENVQPYTDVLKYFPHLQTYVHPEESNSASENTPTFHFLDFLSAFRPEAVTITEPTQGPLYERKVKTYNMHVNTHRIWNEGEFDGFLSATTYDPTSFIESCAQKIAWSGNMVVYNQHREPIIELQNHVMTNMVTRPILAPQIHEIRATKWSTLKGRARPDMLGRGGGGWIFSGIRVEDGMFEEPSEPKPKKKKLKVEENGTAMEDVQTESAESKA
jgi:hypothetical protein